MNRGHLVLVIYSLVLFSFSFSKDKVYLPSDENFPNPERGFFKAGAGSASGLASDRKSKGITLQRTYYHMDAYRNSPLPQSFLDNITNDFKNLRAGGCKGILRFNYNDGLSADAPLATILGHIDQLKPILTANYDVIAFVEAGFIGAWGEWHHSTNGLDNTVSRSQVLEKLLSALPTNRMVALRYNFHKRAIFNTDLPLSATEAHQGTSRSRTGAHNDCLGASEDNWGTYTYGGSNIERTASVQKEKTFLSLDNRYVPQGGETCNVSAYSGCDSSLADLKRMRWDAINAGYHGTVLSSWTNGGCMETIKTHLGYRFQLTKSTMQDSAKPGSSWSMTFSLVNVGWGKVYNPRAVEIVLRQVNGSAKYYFPVNVDPRFWLTDEPVTVTVNAGIPGDMPEGEYKAFLNLPDPAKGLRTRPEYSIHLANPNVWEDSTGFNYLDANVIIKASARGQLFSATGYFTPWGDGSVGLAGRAPGIGHALSSPASDLLNPLQRGWIDIQGRVLPITLPDGKSRK